jgi:hypothetical protein
LTPILDYRRAGPVSVERAGDAVIVTIDFRDDERQKKHDLVKGLLALLLLLLLFGGTVAASEFGEGWLLVVVFFGPVAAVLLWLIIVRRRDLLVDARANDPWWWRLTASPAGLLIEQHNRDGAANSRKFYPRENIRDVTVERNDARDHDIRDAHEVCIYAPLPHREPVRYFAVRHGEGEMIVNAIRAGLGM